MCHSLSLASLTHNAHVLFLAANPSGPIWNLPATDVAEFHGSV